MLFPSIPDYKEALLNGADTFATYRNLEPVPDDYGDVYRIAGGFAVVFKMRDRLTKKLYALKCFHKKKDNIIESYSLISRHLKTYNSPYLVNYEFLEKEMWVSTEVTDETEFPVVLMDWVEGNTLRDELKQAAADHNTKLLHHLSAQFDEMALWLLEQPFAHTDLKTENILVTPNKQLVLVDYDGLFVPEMKGQEAREEGTVGYKHPRRRSWNFNRHTDDFSILLMSLALRLIAQDPKLYTATQSDEHLLFTEADLNDFANSELHRIILEKVRQDNGPISILFSILQMAVGSEDGQILPLPLCIKSTMGVRKKWKLPFAPFTLLQTLTGHEKTLEIYFSPDGKYLVSRDDDSILKVYSVPDFEYLYEIKDDEPEIWTVAFTPDGKHLVYGDDSPVVKYFSLAERRLSYELNYRDDFTWFGALSPDGAFLIGEGAHKTLNVYSVSPMKLICKWKYEADYMFNVKFSPDGKWVAACGKDNIIKVYDFTNKTLVHSFVEDNEISCIRFSADSEWLACGRRDGTVNLYWLPGMGLMHTFNYGNIGEVELTFDPRSNHLVVGSETDTVHLYNLTDFSLETSIENTGDGVCSVRYSLDGKYLAICNEKNIQIYQVNEEEHPELTARQINLDFHYAAKKAPSANRYDTPERRLEWWNDLEAQWKNAFRESILKQVTIPFIQRRNPPDDKQLCEILNVKELNVRGSGTSFADLSFLLTNLTGVKGLTKLEKLMCLGNEISDLEPLKHLTNLKELYCSYNLINDLEPLRGLHDLKVLICSNNNINNVEPLSNLEQLERLNCSYNHITDFSPLNGLIFNLRQFISHENYCNI